jgi:hypothetical protein
MAAHKPTVCFLHLVNLFIGILLAVSCPVTGLRGEDLFGL